MRTGRKKRVTLLFCLRHHILNWSILKISESFIAFQVRNAPIGISTYAEMNAPVVASTAPSLASLVPEMSTTQ